MIIVLMVADTRAVVCVAKRELRYSTYAYVYYCNRYLATFVTAIVWKSSTIVQFFTTQARDMSSRLILLPKKSYTPWNPQNVAKVERDEHLAAEKAEKEREDLAKRKSGISALQRQKHGDNNKHRHVNLFEQEEEDAIHTMTHGKNSSLNDQKRSCNMKSGVDYLGGTELKRRRQEEESSSADGQKNHQGITSIIYKRHDNSNFNRGGRRRSKDWLMRHEKNLKEAMDPMSQFCNHNNGAAELTKGKEQAREHAAEEEKVESSSDSSIRSYGRRNKKGRKRKKQSRKYLRKSSDSSSSKRHIKTRNVDDRPSSQTPSLDELRQRRLERERKERRRSGVAEVRAIEDDRSRRYLDQYNPGLSRR